MAFAMYCFLLLGNSLTKKHIPSLYLVNSYSFSSKYATFSCYCPWTCVLQTCLNLPPNICLVLNSYNVVYIYICDYLKIYTVTVQEIFMELKMNESSKYIHFMLFLYFLIIVSINMYINSAFLYFWRDFTIFFASLLLYLYSIIFLEKEVLPFNNLKFLLVTYIPMIFDIDSIT